MLWSTNEYYREVQENHLEQMKKNEILKKNSVLRFTLKIPDIIRHGAYVENTCQPCTVYRVP